MTKKRKKSWRIYLVSVITVLLVLGVWELCTDILHLVSERALPSPVKVVTTFIEKLSVKAPDGATLGTHLLASLKVSLSGYALGIVIGVPLGIFMAWYEPVDRYARPVFDLLKCIPGVAWVPLMLILFGISMFSKVAVIFMAAVVPCVLNSYAGIKQTKEVHFWVARTAGASDTQMLLTLGIPTALPYIIQGMRVAVGSSWVTIVAAEMLASNKGLGFMIQLARGMSRPDIIIVGMLTIGFVGIILTFLLSIIEKAVVKGRQ